MSKLLHARPFQILALPLARIPRALPHPPPAPAASSPSSSPPPSPAASAPTSAASHSPLVLFQVLQPEPVSDATSKPHIAQRALQKASDQWLKLGQRDKGSWMYWFYSQGERLMDRIEYEEWALKSVVENQGVKVDQGKVVERVEIPLLRPSLRGLDFGPLLPRLHRQLLHRIPFHRKMMVRFLIGSPLTFPFALIPVIPNFPLFYVLWRAWSHYKAYRGATYLDALIKAGVVVEKPSKQLDDVYSAHGIVASESGAENTAPDATAGKGDRATTVDATPLADRKAELPAQAEGKGPAPDGTATPPELVYRGAKGDEGHASEPPAELLLLTKAQATLLRDAFELRPNEVVDVNRAVEQAEQRVKAVQKDKAGVEQERQGEAKASTEWRGNLHR